MRIRYKITLLLLLPLVSATLTAAQTPRRALPGVPARVVKVVDGDTIRVRLDGRTEAVRFIGIDTPESRENNKALRDAGRSAVDVAVIVRAGRLATAHLGALLPEPNQLVYLEFDAERRDRYGRLLAWVHRGDGLMLNEAMVRGGYARTYTVPPNVRYAERLRRAQELARSSGAGLWSER